MHRKCDAGTAAGPGVRAFSGSTGAELWELNSSTFLGIGGDLCAIGDVDGFHDLANLGNLQFTVRGWLIVSGRVLADVRLQSGACGAGTFFPRLGTTRPILGQVVTIAGDDGPLATNGMLLFSLRPATPTWLGASSCFAWFSFGNAAVLQILTTPQWTLTVPVPNAPQLAGIEVALQGCYAPTNGPLGYDLGNGVWARLGYH